MKVRIFPGFPGLLGALLLLGCSLLAGCKSTPSIDWNSRIGNYTFDQAEAELGTPEKVAKLLNGQTEAEWIKYSNPNIGVGMGAGYAGSSGGLGMGQNVGAGYSSKVLRLVFGPDDKLISWSKNY